MKKVDDLKERIKTTSRKKAPSLVHRWYCITLLLQESPDVDLSLLVNVQPALEFILARTSVFQKHFKEEMRHVWLRCAEHLQSSMFQVGDHAKLLALKRPSQYCREIIEEASVEWLTHRELALIRSGDVNLPRAWKLLDRAAAEITELNPYESFIFATLAAEIAYLSPPWDRMLSERGLWQCLDGMPDGSIEKLFFLAQESFCVDLRETSRQSASLTARLDEAKAGSVDPNWRIRSLLLQARFQLASGSDLESIASVNEARSLDMGRFSMWKCVASELKDVREMRMCAGCGRTRGPDARRLELGVCAGCNKQFYCSRECQEQNWRIAHAGQCAAEHYDSESKE